MTYQIIIEKRARRFIEKQPKPQQARILLAISKLPDQGDMKPLQGHSGIFRLRVGDDRILYRIEAETITVVVMDAGNRGQIYK